MERQVRIGATAIVDLTVFSIGNSRISTLNSTGTGRHHPHDLSRNY
jgi:hypothetical protein